jgi:hypothetical protein
MMRGFMLLIFTNYHHGAQIKMGEMSGTGGTHGKDEK